jgi:hypothetical protein
VDHEFSSKNEIFNETAHGDLGKAQEYIYIFGGGTGKYTYFLSPPLNPTKKQH